MKRIGWDFNQLEELKKLWTERNENGRYVHSATQIGLLIGKNKNSVIGKAHRLGLPPRDPFMTEIVKKAPAAMKAAVAETAQRKPIVKPVRNPAINTLRKIAMFKDDHQPGIRLPPTPEEPQMPLPGISPVPFMRLRNRHCRAVLEERGPDGLAMFCGSPRLEGIAYCEHHHLRYHREPGRGVNGGLRTPVHQAYDGHQETPTQSSQCSDGSGDRPETEERRTGTA